MFLLLLLPSKLFLSFARWFGGLVDCWGDDDLWFDNGGLRSYRLAMRWTASLNAITAVGLGLRFIGRDLRGLFLWNAKGQAPLLSTA